MNESSELQGRDFKRFRNYLAWAYFLLPLLLVAIVYRLTCGRAFSSENPVYLWRLCYCFLAGFWGLATRTFHLRKEVKEKSPWPEYFTVYPLALFMNACAVFTVLSIFESRLGWLFWTAALPLCMVLGHYCHPSEWLLTKFLTKQGKNAP